MSIIWVTIPHGGLGTEKQKQLIRSLVRHHPTRWARNEGGAKEVAMKELVTIPHGGLGTTSPFIFTIGSLVVTIPHGGLGTPNHHINQNKTYQSFCQGGTLFK